MAPWISRRDFLPAGLRAEQVELDGTTIRIHARALDAAATCPRCGTISRHVQAGVVAGRPIFPHMGGRWNWSCWFAAFAVGPCAAPPGSLPNAFRPPLLGRICGVHHACRGWFGISALPSLGAPRRRLPDVCCCR